MGNFNSVHLDIPTWAKSESNVEGSIHVNIIKAIDAEDLRLRLISTEFGELAAGCLGDLRSFSYEGFRTSMVVARFSSGRLEPGQYTFPFKITFPELPASFRYSERLFGTSLVYAISAFIVSKGKELLETSREISMAPSPYSTSFSVDRKLLPSPAACSCCAERSDRGHVRLSARLEKPFYEPGQIVRAILTFENSSSLRGAMLELRVDHVISMSVRQGDKRVFNVLKLNVSAEKSFSDRPAELKLPHQTYEPHSYGSHCRQYYRFVVSFCELEISLPIQIQPVFEVAMRSPPGLSETWNPQVSEKVVLTLPANEFRNCRPSGDVFPGLTAVDAHMS